MRGGVKKMLEYIKDVFHVYYDDHEDDDLSFDESQKCFIQKQKDLGWKKYCSKMLVTCYSSDCRDHKAQVGYWILDLDTNVYTRQYVGQSMSGLIFETCFDDGYYTIFSMVGSKSIVGEDFLDFEEFSVYYKDSSYDPYDDHQTLKRWFTEFEILEK